MRRVELLRRRREQFWRQRRAYLASLIAAARRGKPISCDPPIPPCVDNGEHDWILEGQTMTGNIWSCRRCRQLRFA